MTMRILSVALVALSLVACTPHYNGKIQDGLYYDPQHFFCIQDPKFAPDQIILDNFLAEGHSQVIFSDEWGTLFRVEAVKTYDELLLQICKHGITEKNQLQTYFQEGILKFEPASNLVDEKILAHPTLGKVHYSLFFVPEGSTLINMSAKKREDTYRAYLIALNASQMVIFTYQPPFCYNKIEDDMLQQQIFDFAATYSPLD